MIKMSKPVMKTIRLSHEENVQLESSAAAVGMDVSGYIRNALFNPPQGDEAIQLKQRLVAEVSQISDPLTHLANMVSPQDAQLAGFINSKAVSIWRILNS
jgi:hypothetical protein